MIHLQNSELRIMHILWDMGDTPAREIAKILNERLGWSKNTTYTLIKRCITKNAITKHEPNYICHANITREEAQIIETQTLADKIFDGKIDNLFASILHQKGLSESKIQALKTLINENDE